MSDEDYSISTDEAVERLVIQHDYDPGGGQGPTDCVHTFRDAGFGLIGAHMTVKEARVAFEKYGAQQAGPSATETGHGIVIVDETGPLFFEAHPAQGEEIEEPT